MQRIIKNLLNHLSEKPRTIFLIDSLGAILTTFSLFLIKWYFNHYFRIPNTALTYLFIIASVFCIYSISCFLFLKEHWAFFIRIISFANLFYGSLILGLLIKYDNLLTTVGILYFLIEIVIICILSCLELKMTKLIR